MKEGSWPEIRRKGRLRVGEKLQGAPIETGLARVYATSGLLKNRRVLSGVTNA